uniref:AAA domain-containing protein n=1 Tax=Brassica oleracea var. oleracea TaxID=109376 RepID=A0A0D3CUF8_BRAOL
MKMKNCKLFGSWRSSTILNGLDSSKFQASAVEARVCWGKITTTANVGFSLARHGFSVVAIDADLGLRNLDLLLGLANHVNYTVVEVLNGDCRLDQALVRDKRWSNFELLCISKPRSKLPMGFGGKALEWLVDALKTRPEGSPDFIIIDCPAGIDAEFITAITPANEAALVTTPDITR